MRLKAVYAAGGGHTCYQQYWNTYHY